MDTLGTLEYRLFLHSSEKPVSLWHDLPLSAGKSLTDDAIFNFVSEISRGYAKVFLSLTSSEDKKMEMSKEEQWNPIKQDVKKGVLRYGSKLVV